jgi:carbamoyltransferase
MGRLLREGPFEEVWIQPAAGDAGGALGAALSVWNERLGNVRRPVNGWDAMKGAYLGPSYNDAAIESELAGERAVWERLDDVEVCPRVAALLADGRVGWSSVPERSAHARSSAIRAARRCSR